MYGHEGTEMEREHVQVATNKAVSVLGYACSLACRSNL